MMLAEYYNAYLSERYPLLALAIVVAINVWAYKFFKAKFIKRPRVFPIGWLLLSFLSACAVPCGVIAAFVIAYCKVVKQVNNEFDSVWKEIRISPTETLVNQFMEKINKYALPNDPQTWNQVRGVWFMVNECPNITTAKKTEFRNFLMTIGLNLSGNDKNVIDNYKG